MAPMALPASENPDSFLSENSLCTFDHLSKKDVINCANFQVVVSFYERNNMLAVFIEDANRKTALVRILKRKLSFRIEPGQVIQLENFRWEEKFSKQHLMSPTEKCSIVFMKNPVISLNVYLTSQVVTEPINTQPSSLQYVICRHRNVCLRYSESSHKSALRVESLIFFTEDDKKVELTYYRTDGNNSAGLVEGNWYTVLNTFVNAMSVKDLEYCDIRLHTTHFTKVLPVVDENNN